MGEFVKGLTCRLAEYKNPSTLVGTYTTGMDAHEHFGELMSYLYQ